MHLRGLSTTNRLIEHSHSLSQMLVDMQKWKGKEVGPESRAGIGLIAHEVLEDGSLDFEATIRRSEVNVVACCRHRDAMQ